MPRKEKETLSLFLDLTQDEKADLGQELAKEYSRMTQAKADADSASASLKAEMKTAKARVDELSHKLEVGKDYKKIDCCIRWDFTAGTKTWLRLDTGAKVKEAKITDEERQEELDLQAKEKAEAEASGVQQKANLDVATSETEDKAA